MTLVGNELGLLHIFKYTPDYFYQECKHLNPDQTANGAV